MPKIDKILSVLDPVSDDQPALHRAAWLARRTNAELNLLTCYYNEYLDGGLVFESRSLAKARSETLHREEQRLEMLASPLRKNGIVVKTNAVWDRPLHDGIVRHAIDIDADIVFKDTHHHPAIKRSILSNTDWNLIRTCPCPLWLVKPIDWPKSPTIIASIDPMNQHDKPAALDDQILSISRLISTFAAGNVHAFHSYDPRIAIASSTSGPFVSVGLGYDEIEERMRTDHERRFTEVIARNGIDAARSHLAIGVTHSELSALAEQINADLIVMGAIARNRLRRMFIGSTAERALEHLPCDLLIIKPDWFVSPVDAAGLEPDSSQ